jgi:hypothetical protein
MSSTSVEELQEYIKEKMDKLNGIDSMKMSLNPITMTIELNATNKARLIIKEIFSEMISHRTSGVKVKDERDSFHV